MPTQQLPNDPSLENLKKQAKSLHKAVRDADADAVARAREFHPRPGEVLADFSLSDAQLALAREYGFTSWPRLKEHLEVVEQYTWGPLEGPAENEADEFIRLACLTYGPDHTSLRDKARALFAEHPDIARRNIYTAATVGDVAAARDMLNTDASLARRRGGPHQWEPLLYAAYSRLNSTATGHSTLEVARLLLEHGADPNAGYLWHGSYAFTALTGAFGEGESGPVNQPPHQYSLELARLLLEAGADPNDGQSLYNRMFSRNDDHLKLLFEFGLGRDQNGPWVRRMSDRAYSPARMLAEELWWAAMHNHVERTKLLVQHGADVNMASVRDGRAPYETAMLNGNREIAEYLLDRGAKPTDFDALELFAGACIGGDCERIMAMVAADPALPDRIGSRQAELLNRAADNDRRDAVRVMVELGFDVNAMDRTTALHQAAWRGHLEMVKLLIELGADLAVRDTAHDATPLGWAQYGHQQEVVEYLESIDAPG